MILDLQDFVPRYVNQKNPSTNRLWTPAEIAAAYDIDEKYFAEVFGIVKNANDESIAANGVVATTAEILSAFEKAHPGADPLFTPFGLIWSVQAQGSDRKLGDLTVSEAISMFPGLLKS
jgi:hypothetical protein